MINISLTSQTVSTSKDGSTEFVFAEKKFPLHMREDCAAVFLEGLDEGVCVYGHMTTYFCSMAYCVVCVCH